MGTTACINVAPDHLPEVLRRPSITACSITIQTVGELLAVVKDLRSAGARLIALRGDGRILCGQFVWLRQTGTHRLAVNFALGPAMQRLGLGRLAVNSAVILALLGPDGSGKTTLGDSVLAALRACFRETKWLHWRPRLLSRTPADAQPVAFPPSVHARRGYVASVIHLATVYADYLLGYLAHVARRFHPHQLVIMDRLYFTDLLIDPARYRYRGPLWLPRLLARGTPTPDLTIILDAPASVIAERKSELPRVQLMRQLEAFRALCQRSASAVLIDTGASKEDSAAQTLAVILDSLDRKATTALAKALGCALDPEINQ